MLVEQQICSKKSFFVKLQALHITLYVSQNPFTEELFDLIDFDMKDISNLASVSMNTVHQYKGKEQLITFMEGRKNHDESFY